MKRRQFIAGLGAAAAWPLAAPGHLFGTSRQGIVGDAAFMQGMRELGYIEGKDFVGELRFADGQYERLPDLAAELVQSRADILVAALSPAVRALQQATRTIPIVFCGIVDPVGQGAVASLAHPGGNITGLASSIDDTAPKQMELLIAASPGLSRVGLLQNPDNPVSPLILSNVQHAARQAGLDLMRMDARNSKEVDDAFAAFVRAGLQAVMVDGEGTFIALRQKIAKVALDNRLLSISPPREYSQAGGLMSYGEDKSEFDRRCAAYVDKIIKGAKPADLPVEQPTRFHLVINLATAKLLGLTVPPNLLALADEVIE